MRKRCFGEYCAFNDECDRCHELKRYCKIWKNNIFNFKRRRNLAIFICFIIIVAWNFNVGFHLVRTNFKSFTILNFSAILLFFLVLGKGIKSRKIATEAYQTLARTKDAIDKTASACEASVSRAHLNHKD